MRTALALAVLARALPSAAMAQEPAGSVTAQVPAPSYGTAYDREEQREAVLQRLRKVCRSHIASDRAACRYARQIIAKAKGSLGP